jgi:hypothetical protein
MRTILTFAAAMAMAALAWAGGPAPTPVQKKAPAKKPATTGAVAKKPVAAPVKKPVSGATSAAARRTRTTPVVRTSWRNRQSAPTPDRYREIQSALVAKGFLAPEDANGAWGTSSAEALKKFQADETLESTGKIDALSLIALGLGPKHDSTVPRVGDANLPPLEAGRN